MPEYATALLVFGIILVLIGLVGNVKAKEIEVGTKSIAARVIIGTLGVALIALSLIMTIPGLNQDNNSSESETTGRPPADRKVPVTDPVEPEVPVTDPVEPKPGNLQFSSNTYELNESGGSITINVSRINGSDGPAAVFYTTNDHTAEAGSDYEAADGMLTWKDGEMGSKKFKVSVLNDEGDEPNESLKLKLENFDGADVGFPQMAVLTIVDDDQPQPKPPPQPKSNSKLESDCEAYANKAVNQHQQNLDRACGFKGPAWTSDFASHNNWCLDLKPENPVCVFSLGSGKDCRGFWTHEESKARETGLVGCKATSSFCEGYAEQARQKIQQNGKRGCVINSLDHWPRWWPPEGDANTSFFHYRWCYAVPEHLAKSESEARKQALANCP